MCLCSTGLDDLGDALYSARVQKVPFMCEVHGDRFKEFPTDSGGDSTSSPEYPRCAPTGGVAFNLSKSIYHFSYWLISRAPLIPRWNTWTDSSNTRLTNITWWDFVLLSHNGYPHCPSKSSISCTSFQCQIELFEPVEIDCKTWLNENRWPLSL